MISLQELNTHFRWLITVQRSIPYPKYSTPADLHRTLSVIFQFIKFNLQLSRPQILFWWVQNRHETMRTNNHKSIKMLVEISTNLWEFASYISLNKPDSPGLLFCINENCSSFLSCTSCSSRPMNKDLWGIGKLIMYYLSKKRTACEEKATACEHA